MRHPDPRSNARYAGPWGSDNGGPEWQPVQVRQQGARPYPGEVRDPRRTGAERLEPWSGNRQRPGLADSETTAGHRFSPGWVSAILIFALLGLGLVQLADSKALHGEDYLASVNLFFAGLILIFLPATARILMRKTARAERFTLVILVGVAFYVVKVLSAPDGFLQNDEFIHLRNTQNILASGHLFQYNPLLPTVSYYPGLAGVTAALVDLTGLSAFVSGLIIIGVARIVISASLFLVAEKVTGSSRGAGMASLFYATNCMFLLWSAAFSYESLALPLAAFVVWWICRTRGIRGQAVAAQGITIIGIVAVTVTHHISAFALCGILAALYIAECIFKSPLVERRYVGIFAALTGVLAAFWFFVVAKPAAAYLFGQNFDPAVQSALSIVSGKGGQRELYGGDSGLPPKWYVYVGFLGILIIMGALLPAALRAWRILRTRGLASTMRRRAPIAVAALLAITFPFTLLPRLTADGSAISGRTTEFIFTAIGCTLGLLMVDVARSDPSGARRSRNLVRAGGIGTLLATLLLSLVFVGQVSIGNSFYMLLPDDGNIGFAAYVQPSMISVAKWAQQHLGAHQTFATDSTDQLALAVYGEENPANVNVIYPMFFTASMDNTVVSLIRTNSIHYVLLDWLETTEPPVQPGGSYYSGLEPDTVLKGGPLPKAYFSKFSTYTCSRLVYQSGSIQIYDVSQIAKGSCVPRLIHAASGKASQGKKSKNPKAKASS